MKKAPKRLGLGDLLGMKYYPPTWGLYISINHGLRIAIKVNQDSMENIWVFFLRGWIELGLTRINGSAGTSPWLLLGALPLSSDLIGWFGFIFVSGGWVASHPNSTTLFLQRNGFQRKEQVKIKKSRANNQVSGSQTPPFKNRIELLYRSFHSRKHSLRIGDFLLRWPPWVSAWCFMMPRRWLGRWENVGTPTTGLGFDRGGGCEMEGWSPLGLWKPHKQREGGDPLEAYVNTINSPKLLQDLVAAMAQFFNGPGKYSKTHPSGWICMVKRSWGSAVSKTSKQSNWRPQVAHDELRSLGGKILSKMWSW